MSEEQLAKNIQHYRRMKGLSQEKVAEYMGVSRQAVTKWENNSSRPSSDHLIKLARLFEINIDTLLESKKSKKISVPTEITTGKAPWLLIGISILCIFLSAIYSAMQNIFSIGAFICVFILCVPIQLFLHIYLSNAIKNNSFHGIAGFDSKIEYRICEVKKLLVQIDLHIGSTTTVYIFLLCVINCINWEYEWLTGFLFIFYLFHITVNIIIINYKTIDTIYLKEDDKKRARNGFGAAILYVLLLFAGIGIAGVVFEAKKIENNTLPAIKLCGLLLLGIISATFGFLSESRKIKKQAPPDSGGKIHKTGIISLFICLVIYGLLYFV